MEDTPTCYICMEESSGMNPFLTRSMCACSSKASSSLKVHQLCMELCRDRTGSCAVCKQALDEKWAFDGRYDIKWENGDMDRIVITQLKKKVKHGSYFVLGDTDAFPGPIRYLAERGSHKEGQLDGQHLTFWRNGAVRTEVNYEAGVLHGRSRRNAEDGTLTSEASYARGARHGLQKSFYYGVALSGTYENDVKVGDHVEQAEAYMHVRRVTYVAGVRDGACIEFHVEAGDQLPTIIESYRAGQLHGLQEIYVVDVETLTSTLKVEAHWIDGKKNGRHAIFHGDQLECEKHYHMDLEHGVQRTYCGAQLMEEITYHLGTKHGRHRIWMIVGGRRIPFMDATYDNGNRHGRHRYMKHGFCHTESYWSDGTKELRHGRWTVSRGPEINPKSVIGERMCQESNWHTGVRHGISRSWENSRLAYSLNFKSGKMDGECRLYESGSIRAIGIYKAGIPAGLHTLHDGIVMKEAVNFDEAGLFHGTCSYYNSDGSRFQELNFVHGVLNGRQCFYSNGRPSRVINMRDGHVEGRFTLYDERGEFEERIVKRGDLDFDEAMAGGVLCAPSEHIGGGDFEFRYLCADSTVVACKLEAGSPSCECATCTRPRRSCACSCAYCCDDDDYDDYDW